ncbi:oligosaccharide flippase family protein [Ideonella sp. DXS29W]|uniref:Oligosaccharide flippase family protein n=1 Tax=Ideonella lacteola TaxID=2984193 RepID=A0ABU9BPI1_9BURK
MTVAWSGRFSEWMRQSRFARNVWQVARANVLAQALPVIAAPLLTRLYSPADFGGLALFASVLSVALAVGTVRFEWSVPSARAGTTAAALMVLGSLALCGCSFLLLFAWVAARHRLPSAWSVIDAMGWLVLPALVGGGIQQLLQAWHVRRADLSPMGRAKVMQSAANLLVCLAAAKLGLYGLVAGAVAGVWVGLRTLWLHATGLSAAIARLDRRRLAVAWRRFRAEAGWSTLASAVSTASFAIVPFMLARHYSAVEVGYYALMQRVALGPVGLVGAAVSQSFWAEAARLVRADPALLSSLYRRSSWRLVWVALPLALVALAGPLFVGPLFGDVQWAGAGWVLAASVPMLIGQVIVSPLSHLIIHGKQHWQALWDVLRMALLAGSIEGLGRAGVDFPWTVLGLSTVMGAMYGLLMLLNRRALKFAQE